MKTRVMMSVLMMLPLIADAMSKPAQFPDMKLQGTFNCPFISSKGGTAYLQIVLETPGIASEAILRRPMNISVVLDRSGSMADERKMEYAKSALSKLIDQLSTEDVFSLVVYDDVIEVLQPAHRVGRKKAELKRLISDIYPRNSTNLGGGMLEGLRQVEKKLGKEYVNRVVLLSDGLANQGITNSIELNQIAQKYRNKAISLTTMGVGLDYNENLMVGLAESGGGNYYFIESPSQLASIMSRELNSLSTVVAQNAFIELNLDRGVRVLDVIGSEMVRTGDVVRIPVGDLYANDTREFTVELSIAEGAGKRTVASGRLRSERAEFGPHPSFVASITHTRDLAAIEKHRNLDVQAKADVAISTRTVESAMKALDEGRAEEAKSELQSARDMLIASPAASSSGAGGEAIQAQAELLDSFSDSLENTDARRAKKSIQYENYRVQKKKK